MHCMYSDGNQLTVPLPGMVRYMQKDLALYNIQQPHQGYNMKGKRPLRPSGKDSLKTPKEGPGRLLNRPFLEGGLSGDHRYCSAM